MEIINSDFKLHFDDVSNFELDSWDVFLNIKFNESNVHVIKLFYHNFINNYDKSWNLFENNVYGTFKYFNKNNKQEKKFIVYFESDDNEIYYICNNDHYVCYCREGYKTTLITHNTKDIVPSDTINEECIVKKWDLSSHLVENKSDNKIVYEYIQFTDVDYHGTKTKYGNFVPYTWENYFYFIHHTDKNILEIFNGSHWIFELHNKINIDNDFITNLLKKYALSLYIWEYDKKGKQKDYSVSDDIFEYMPGDLIYFASKNRMYVKKNNEVLIDVSDTRTFIHDNIYHPDRCDHITKLGYDLSLDYDIIDFDNTKIIPSICYKRVIKNVIHDVFTKRMSYTSRSHIDSYDILTKMTTFDTNYKMFINLHLVNSEKSLLIKFNSTILLHMKFDKNYDIITKYIYNHIDYNKLIKSIDGIDKIIFDPSPDSIYKFLDFYVLKKDYLEQGDEQDSKKSINMVCDIKTRQINFQKKCHNKLNKKYDIRQKNDYYLMKKHLCLREFDFDAPDNLATNSDVDNLTIKNDTNSNSSSTEYVNFDDYEINMKIDLNTKEIIMNDLSGIIIENDISTDLIKLDLKEHVITPIKYGYKYGTTDDNKQVIIELELPENAKIVSGSNKNRINKCIVLRIYDPLTNEDYLEAKGKYKQDFKYTVGDEIVINNYIVNSNLCEPGIHFCHSIEELKKQSW
ncbi:MAG: hypothetical protein Terrestrivirus1_295 [Terrestrivirus sp.]|uniref:Uncharacterized protein n=1 Tax=Terrestrivirus sp. TaxID=2487775 RepID=A0A3G4ZN67_9VIRU|nr:MAG: hypothetical protein Terrestrivirus1_295 [Terrestrivirus sp.]